MSYSLGQLLQILTEQGGSDLHISVNSPPRVRIDGELRALNVPPLNPEETRKLCCSALNPEQLHLLEEHRSIDLSFNVPEVARFRANIYVQQGSISGAFRYIAPNIKTLGELGLPPQFMDFCSRTSGLVLVTGATGSGKSTSLAAMVDHINTNSAKHIITIEDPVEYVHQHKRSIISHREIGSDTDSFHGALRGCLRQDPDVIMVGEMRDHETVSAALTAAETGHLVLSTVHTRSAISSLNRIIDMFPPHQQDQIRTQLAHTMVGIITQQLVPMMRGGRALALEILKNNHAVSALITDGKFKQIYSAMQSGQTDSQMITMNQSLQYLVMNRYISKTEAVSRTTEASELIKMLSGDHEIPTAMRRSS